MTYEIKEIENRDTTDFPNYPCRLCGKKDRPQFEGICNDGHCGAEENMKKGKMAIEWTKEEVEADNPQPKFKSFPDTIGPTRASTIPSESAKRKEYPIATGFMDYFPDAIAAVANVSFVGNQQHNPGQPLHWARNKSTDEPDTIIRHFLQRGTLDDDGLRHSAKLAWRALAMLQKEIESEGKPILKRTGDEL